MDLHDPTHHAYSDVKRNLAQALIENGERTPATFKEAAKLLDETLQSSLRVSDKQGVLGAHRVRAQLLAEQGKRVEALAGTTSPSGLRMNTAQQRQQDSSRANPRAGGVSRLPGSDDEQRGGTRRGKPAARVEE